MDFEKIKGYNNLLPNQKLLFQTIYAKHQSCLGLEARKDYEPKTVKWEKTFFKVTFKNGIWLHYTPQGRWY